MNIALSTYRPFDCTKALFEWQREHATASNCLGLAKVIAVVALTILATLPVVMVDLTLTAASLLYRCCCAQKPPSPPPLSFPRRRSIIDRPLDKPLIERVLTSPFSRNVSPSNEALLKYAIRTALNLNTLESATIYKELIEGDGALSENPHEDPAIDIYMWCAGCLLSQYLIAKLNQCDMSKSFFETHPPSFGSRLTTLYSEYVQPLTSEQVVCSNANGMTKKDLALAFLKIMAPSDIWPMTGKATVMVYKINELALELTQKRQFMTEIYRPVASKIDNI